MYIYVCKYICMCKVMYLFLNACEKKKSKKHKSL